MERYTSDVVSSWARHHYLRWHPESASAFQPERGTNGEGWRMFGWRSDITEARAGARGQAILAGQSIHPFDEPIL